MENRVALVTGASRGLGAAIADRLGADGFAVAVNYFHDDEGASSVAKRIIANGGRADVFKYDVTNEEQVQALVDDVESNLGPIFAVVVNATGPQPLTEPAALDWQVMLDQLHFFVKSPMLLMTALLPRMKKRSEGRIVHIGSEVLGTLPAGMSAYTAAKSAQLGLARSWAKELAPFNILVNTVAPGWIPVERHEDTPAEDFESYQDTVPLGYQGAPSDVASAVSFLVSDDARFMTGVKLTVNGGSTVD